MAVPLLFVVLVVLVFLLAACGSGTQSGNQPETSLPAAHVDEATAGTISGRVLFTGVAPVMPEIDFSSNPFLCERQHHQAVEGGNSLRW